MTDLVTINTDNYAAMAKAMGIANEKSDSNKEKASTLARLRIHHTPIMGTAEVKGKEVNVEVVEGGMYKLEIPDGPTYFSKNIKVRPFMQRFMYKRFVMGKGDTKNRYIKTIMADNLNIDLKDSDGGFNCGKPSGWIEDFKALPENQQQLIRSCKRVRVVFGLITMSDPVDATGNSVDVQPTAFIWEVENKDAFKSIGKCFNDCARAKRLPVQHEITLSTEENKLASGAVFYLPSPTLDLSSTIEVGDDDQTMFSNLMLWIKNYNDYILNQWNENAHKKESHDTTLKETLDEFIDIDTAEVVS
tara:strand:+ start:694 stop:1602 length:909 start_codon:yes stop_codon:yes gene_type:complete